MREELIGPISQPAAHELAMEQIKRCIQLGLFLPGEKLPPERILAERLSVSRSTIREAVRLLQDSGLIEVRRGATGGLVVRDSQVEDPVELRAWIRRQRAHLNELMDFRLVIEGAAAELAACRRTDDDLSRLEAAMQRMEQSKLADLNRIESAQVFNAADTEFHMEIALAARNSMLAKAVEDIRREMFLPFGGYFIQSRNDADIYHRHIFDAIFDRDDERARAMMQRHIDSTKKAIIAFLEDDALLLRGSRDADASP